MVVIVGCTNCNERAGIDQDHRPNSARRISSECSAKSGSPVLKLPTKASHVGITGGTHFDTLDRPGILAAKSCTDAG
jgi:hypothetical protein